MDVIANIIASVMLIAAIVCGCLIALLTFWHFSKQDIKKYLCYSNDKNVKIKVKK